MRETDALILVFVLLLTFGGVGAGAAQPPEERFFDWTDLQFPAEEYQRRRDRMLGRLAARDPGLLLVPSGEGRSGGETFRVLNDFNYFVGLELPNSMLVMDASRDRTVLFIPSRDPRFESPSRRNDFPGRPLADDPEVAQRLGISDVRSLEGLPALLSEAAQRDDVIYVDLGAGGDVAQLRPDVFAPWGPGQQLAAHLQSEYPGVRLANAFSDIARSRMVKSPREIAAIRRAIAVTAGGIEVAAAFIRPGVDERTLEGELEAEFKRRGAQRPAFASIIKSGPNSLWPWRVLASHYDRRNRRMEVGDLVIFDVGAELDYYSSDVGRTFPVSGVFTDEQRAILAMEVSVADAIIAAVRPGVTMRDLQAIAEASVPDEHRQYMQTGLFFGHHIGLAVGDPSLAEVPLEPGMIFTVEPWYYNHDIGVAVFTEDDILVTETGSENLSRRLPRSAEGLERMVGGAAKREGR